MDASPHQTPTARPSRLPALLSLLAFGLYIFTAAPTAFWLDSSELAAGAFELGVPHPPGHPVFVLLGRLATLVPVGTIAFRVHLLCAGLCAGAVALAARVALRVWGEPGRWGAAAVLPLLAVSAPFWLHGVRAEVYPLHLVLAAAMLAVTLRLCESPRVGQLALLAFVAGLALANHHYLTVFLAPGVVALLVAFGGARHRLRRELAAALPFLLYGLLPYLLLPIRAAAYPTVRWGEPQTAKGFLWVVSARAFQKTTQRAQRVSGPEAASHLGQFFTSQLGWIALCLAALGLLLLLRRRTRLGIGVLLLLGFNLLTQVLFDFDPTNPDVAGYFLLSVWLLGVLAVGPLAALVSAAPSRGRTARGLACAASVALPLAGALVILPDAASRADLSRERGTDVLADAAYGFVRTDGLLITGYFETIFNLWYRDVAECRRPDVAVVHRLFRTYPGYDDGLRHRYPDLSPMLDVDPAAGALDTGWLLGQAATRSVLVEVDPTLQAELRPRLLPAGVLQWLSPQPVPDAPWPDELVQADRRFWERLYQQLDLTQPETAGNLLWLHVNQLVLFAQQGQIEAARDRFERAWQLAPGDRDLERIAASYGLLP